MTVHARAGGREWGRKEEEAEEEKSPSTSPAHTSTGVGRMCWWQPPASTAFPALQLHSMHSLQGPGNYNTHIHIHNRIYTALHRPPFCPAELPVYAKDNWPNGLSLPLQLNTEWGGCSPPALEYWLTSVWTQQPFTRSHQSKDVRTECLFWDFFSFFWLWNLNTSVLCSVCRNAPRWLKKYILYYLTFKAVVIESRFWSCPARLVTCLWFWKRADRQRDKTD